LVKAFAFAFDLVNGAFAWRLIVKGSSIDIKFTDINSNSPKELPPRLFSPIITTKAKGMGMTSVV
jgi:hypothetical protein